MPGILAVLAGVGKGLPHFVGVQQRRCMTLIHLCILWQFCHVSKLSMAQVQPIA